MTTIDKKQLRKLKRAIFIDKYGMYFMWGSIILYAILMAIIIAFETAAKRTNWLAFMLETHTTIFVILFFLFGILILPLWTSIFSRTKVKKIMFCNYLAGLPGITADEMMEIGEKYEIMDVLFLFAVEKRLQELGITKVPRCCYDGREIFRLPTKEDLEDPDALVDAIDFDSYLD